MPISLLLKNSSAPPPISKYFNSFTPIPGSVNFIWCGFGLVRILFYDLSLIITRGQIRFSAVQPFVLVINKVSHFSEIFQIRSSSVSTSPEVKVMIMGVWGRSNLTSCSESAAILQRGWMRFFTSKALVLVLKNTTQIMKGVRDWFAC